jgi:hypothetical protein
MEDLKRQIEMRKGEAEPEEQLIDHQSQITNPKSRITR